MEKKVLLGILLTSNNAEKVVFFIVWYILSHILLYLNKSIFPNWPIIGLFTFLWTVQLQQLMYSTLIKSIPSFLCVENLKCSLWWPSSDIFLLFCICWLFCLVDIWQEGDGAATEETKKSNHVLRKIEKRQAERKLDSHLEEQFSSGRLYACISSRPGQCGRADG